MRLINRSVVTVCLSALVSIGSACESGTGGRPITFELALRSDLPERGGRPFTTRAGWDVVVEQACLAMGPVYLWSGAAHLARGRGFELPSLVRRAHAHVGNRHFNSGDARGELVSQVAFDASSADGLLLRELNGLHGSVKSFSLLLEPPRQNIQQDACLRGHHAYIVGVAERSGRVVPFEGGLDIASTGSSRLVEGIPLSGDLDEGSRVVITLHASAWVADAKFDTLTEQNAEGRFLITPTSQVRDAWFIAARGAGTFTGEIAPKAAVAGP